jgi:TATA-binding protein-associated factor Taf7
MSTLSEIEMAVPGLSADELAELEQFIRKARREKERAQRPSLRNIQPASVGKILEPIGARGDW